MVDSIKKQVEELNGLMETRLGMRGTFAGQVKKAGRLLPRAVRRDARYLAQAASLADNPKLLPMIDQSKADRAFRRVSAHLETVDAGYARKTKILNILGSISLVLIVVFVLVVTVLVKRGFV